MGEPPTIIEVQDAIRSLKNNKATGPDGIPAEILKEGGLELLYLIHALLLKVWEKEELPSELRDALIVTIFKKGDKAESGNFRGISLLSTTKFLLVFLQADYYHCLRKYSQNHNVSSAQPEVQQTWYPQHGNSKKNAAFVHGFYWPDKGFCHGRQPGPVEYTIKVYISEYWGFCMTAWKSQCLAMAAPSLSLLQWKQGSNRDASLHPRCLPFSLQPYSTSLAKSCHRDLNHL